MAMAIENVSNDDEWENCYKNWSSSREGRSNGPYADSFPLPCHFQGGGWGGVGLRTSTYMA